MTNPHDDLRDEMKMRAASRANDSDATKHDPSNGQFTSGGGGGAFVGDPGDAPHIRADVNKFKRGDMVRENRHGAQPSKVLGRTDNLLHMADGRDLHVSKAVHHS